ncbi:MAG: DUF4386 domain-containing protein [Chloroflexi bacterium]|nr:DUF4386 domain-containing protein [Chloroflexota bacterium]
MTNNITDLSQRKVAIVAGVALIIMAITAGFSFGFVLDTLTVAGDATATFNNIKASEGLFRAGIGGWLLILILDVLVAWALYIFLKPVNKSLSLLGGWLRLVYTAVLGAALLNFAVILLIISGADYLNIFEESQLQALVLLFLNAFHGVWAIGLVIFGCHLFVLGYLVFKSNDIPKILGILLILAALGYLITNLGNLLLPNYETLIATIETIFMLPMIAGEVGLALWLLFKGGK